ncbi:MAG: bifunctional nuclease family protein [Bacteroidales bacterium]|nr:bifunctional nuclease family protein [Bacteroidales bacterium]
MVKVELEIVAITYSQSQSGAYVLILGEIDGKRKLPILIGQFEAQAIAMEMQSIKPPRPLTHDLLKNVIKNFNIKLNEVIIHDFKEGTYYALLILEKDNKIYQVDSRPSDAVALALRFNCPIYTTPQILDETGFILSETEEKLFAQETHEEASQDEGDPPLHFYTLEELEKMLEEAVQNENYELASKIRDEIKRKKAK